MSALSRMAAVVKREPAILTTAAGAAVAIGTSFGFHLNPTETRELYGGCATLTALLIRQAVTPNVKVPKGGSALTVDQRLARVEAAVSELARVAEPSGPSDPTISS